MPIAAKEARPAAQLESPTLAASCVKKSEPIPASRKAAPIDAKEKRKRARIFRYLSFAALFGNTYLKVKTRGAQGVKRRRILGTKVKRRSIKLGKSKAGALAIIQRTGAKEGKINI